MVTVRFNHINRELELGDAQITYVKRASDIGDISKAASSYAWSFKIPRSPHNQAVLEGLGINGSTSRKPYEKIPVTILDNGYPIEVDGRLKIMSTTRTEYKATVQAGIIEFFQQIGKDTVSPIIDLSEMNHELTLQEVLDSWAGLTPYKYIVAFYNREYKETDYNGSDVTDMSIISMTPSLSMEFLFQKIFTYYEWTYDLPPGVSIENDWITYPNAVDQQELPSDIVMELTGIDQLNDPTPYQIIQFNQVGYDPNFVTALQNGVSFTITSYGNYTIQLPGVSVHYQPSGQDVAPIKVFKNGVEIYQSNEYAQSIYFGALVPGDEFKFFVSYGLPDGISGWDLIFDQSLKVTHHPEGQIDFVSAFIDYKVIDFIKEVMIRKGLIAFVRSEQKHIEFKTISQIINAQPQPMDDVVQEVESEEYVFSSYAQNNYFKHKHDEDYETFRDGNLQVDNENLEIENTIFQSKTYAPLSNFAVFHGENNVAYNVPILKMFQPEIKEKNGQQVVEYKSLKDRFHVIGFTQSNKGILVSGNFQQSFPVASIAGKTFEDIITERYADAIKIINDTKIYKVKLALSKMAFLSLDLRRPVYFRNAFYLINKITYKTGGNLTDAELIKINF